MNLWIYRVLFLVLMFVVGAVCGSFLCCQARRLRAREAEGKKLGKRSVCLHCEKVLKWYENLPIISWLIQKGRCRKCGCKIGAAEILSEIMMGTALLLLGLTINIETATGLEWAGFLSLAVFVLVLGFLAIYDGLYGELPVFVLTIAVICAIMAVILRQWSLFLVDGFSWGLVVMPVASAMVLAVPYGLLYLGSKGAWMGDGDWILGAVTGLALGEPFLSLVAIFVTNLAASVVMYPLVRKKSSKKIHLGPFMVFGFVVTYVFADLIMIMV